MSIEVKICGMTNADDVSAALEFGAEYIGFVFYSKSPRVVTPKQVRAILKVAGARAKAVGVFVNESRDGIEQIVKECGLYAVQLHGDEACTSFEGMAVPVWRAVRFDRGAWRPDPAQWKADRYLVDAAKPGIYGGSGIKADWKSAGRLAHDLPVMLAGGLTPENVADAIRAVQPCGVDVVSGVESAPGRKDREKMRRFIAAARNEMSNIE